MSGPSDEAHEDYNRFRQCAAEGCARHCWDGGDARLERVSPKGAPFVGLCQDHFGRSVVLREQAAAFLEEQGEL